MRLILDNVKLLSSDWLTLGSSVFLKKKHNTIREFDFCYNLQVSHGFALSKPQIFLVQYKKWKLSLIDEVLQIMFLWKWKKWPVSTRVALLSFRMGFASRDGLVPIPAVILSFHFLMIGSSMYLYSDGSSPQRCISKYLFFYTLSEKWNAMYS